MPQGVANKKIRGYFCPLTSHNKLSTMPIHVRLQVAEHVDFYSSITFPGQTLSFCHNYQVIQ